MRRYYAQVTPAPPPDSRSFVASLLDNPYVAAILCAAAVLWIAWTLADARTLFNQVGFRGDQNDFACYYTWAYAMREGINPYTADLRELALKLGLAMDQFARADYPPTFILLLEPLTLVPFTTAYWIWTGLNLAALIWALFLLLGSDSGLRVNTAFALGALALFYRPINLYEGQPHMILLAMMVVASLCFHRGRDLAGGAILAFGGLLKVYPLFIVGYLLVKRRWRAVFFTALGLVIGAAATMAVIGVPRTLAFGGRLTYVASGGFLAANYLTGDSRLINIDALVSRLFWQIASTDPAMDWARRLLVLCAQITLLRFTVYATAVSRTRPDRDQCAFALWVVTAALLAPTAWVHYMTLLLFVFAVLAIATIRGEAPSLAIGLGLTSFLLMAFLNHLAEMFVMALPPLPEYLLSTNFYALLTLLAYASAWRLTTGPTMVAAKSVPHTEAM
jgi:hypothetical protein